MATQRLPSKQQGDSELGILEHSYEAMVPDLPAYDGHLFPLNRNPGSRGLLPVAAAAMTTAKFGDTLIKPSADKVRVTSGPAGSS